MKLLLKFYLKMKVVLLVFFGLLMPLSLFSQLPTATTVANQMTIGWNIGNSLEVPGDETGWGNPATTQTLINAVKAAGFNTIRIPCAWDSYSSSNVISTTWLARVKQVVDYCTNNNMYVILNIHWDGGWLEENCTQAMQTSVNTKQNTYWTQIANYFKSYDEHLLFASANEPNVSDATQMAVLLSYHQTFINAVRATGGNNSSRTLIVQGPSTDIEKTNNLMNTMPTDQISSRLMAEIHYYTPWNFCGMTADESWGSMFYYWGSPNHSTTDPSRNPTWGEESAVESYFQMMKTKFVDKGIPVVMGEYGAIKRTSLTGDALALHIASREYYFKYVTDAAIRYGIIPVYWDNGYNGDGGFALFNRTTGAVLDQGAVDALMEGAGVGNTTYYTLSTSTSGSGSISLSPSGGTYASGTTVTLTATPNSGYVFSGWGGSLSGSTNPVTLTMNSNKSVTASFVTQPSGGGTGTILREYWTGITGTAISSLTSNSNYPNNPTGSEQITSFEGPTNWADNYGTRIRGYVHPSTTGSYTFWVAGDDYTDLYLSSTSDPANASRIAYVSGWTNSREWTKYSSQSATVNLTGGVKYYIEVLSKEGSGGDNVAVAWSGPGISQTVIPGSYLSPYEESSSTIAVTSVSVSPTSSNLTAGQTIQLSKTINPTNATNQTVSWSTSNSSVATVNSSGLVTSVAAGTASIAVTTADGNKTASCLVTVTSSSCTPTTITPYLQINDGSWTLSSSATINSGDKLIFGPQPTSGGTWSWSGSGTSGTSREQTIYPTASGTATATFTNSSGCQSSQVFTITVNDGSPNPITLTIQENETGFCSVDGSIDNNNAGFTGTGFANTNNATNNGVSWSVSIPSAGSYNLVWKYANGGSTDRTGQLMVDGSTIVSSVSMPSTGSWTTWNSTNSTTVSLSAGTRLIRLQATTSTGLSNIDYISITGVNPSGVSCVGQKSAETSLAVNSDNIKIYPNPASGNSINLVGDLDTNSEVNLTIYNEIGKTVYFKHLGTIEKGGFEESININELHTGIYFIKLIIDSNVKTMKFIKK